MTSEGGGAVSSELLGALLERTSRTFALSIPVLPEPLRRQVTVAYLLFRIADTIEDATRWDGARKDSELAALHELLRRPDPERARSLGAAWVAEPPLEHAGYLELLAHTADVVEAFAALAAAPRRAILSSLGRTIEGMRGFVRRAGPSGLRLRDLEELAAYCYVVAGIVGEMLTDLFVLAEQALGPVAAELRAEAADFGEALQLVNVLKDSAGDAREGRVYVPEEVGREPVLARARRDLRVASRYCERLHEAGASRGLVEFTVLPVLLAWATLEVVEKRGPGAKIGRQEVFAIVQRMHEALERGQPGEVLRAAADGGLLAGDARGYESS